MNPGSGAVIMGGHFQGLGVVRALAKKRIPVVVLDHEPCLARLSRFVWRFYKSPPPCQEKQLIEFLIQLTKNLGGSKWVVYPTDDLTLMVLSKNKKLLDQYYFITTPSWDITQYAYNKKKSYRLAEKVGIPIPKTYYPDSFDDISHYNLTFPVLIKPDVMNCFIAQTGKKVFYAENMNELAHYYHKALSIIPKEAIMIQDFIPKIHENLYSFCPMIKNGKVMAYITAKRIRQHPMDFGRASTYVVTIKNNELEELGTRILKAMKFYGICEVEFAYDIRDNKYKFLEVNPRIWGWHSIAQSAGVNLPFILYSDVHGKELKFSDYDIGKKWVHWITDFATSFVEIINGRMTMAEYLASIREIDEPAVFLKNDLMPFIGELMLIPYLIYKRGF